jgi:hypothetical protein
MRTCVTKEKNYLRIIIYFHVVFTVQLDINFQFF